MALVRLEADLLDGVAQFIADRNMPPDGKMTRAEAVNVIVRDWLMAQGYLPLPGDPDESTTALEAAKVPET